MKIALYTTSIVRIRRLFYLTIIWFPKTLIPEVVHYICFGHVGFIACNYYPIVLNTTALHLWQLIKLSLRWFTFIKQRLTFLWNVTDSMIGINWRILFVILFIFLWYYDLSRFWVRRNENTYHFASLKIVNISNGNIKLYVTFHKCVTFPKFNFTISDVETITSKNVVILIKK